MKPHFYAKIPLDGSLLREVPLLHLSNKTVKHNEFTYEVNPPAREASREVANLT